MVLSIDEGFKILRISTVKPWNLPKSQFVKNQNFKTMIFTTSFMNMNKHACKLFKYMLYGVKTEVNWEIITA